MNRVLLISMPFAAVEMPSLALGLFKASLSREGIPCDIQYLNLTFAEMIGYDDYAYVVMLPAVFAGEQLFAKQLFGASIPSNEDYYRALVAPGNPQSDIPPRLERVRAQVPAFLRYCLEAIPWHRYSVIGFTTLFEQNLASLLLAHHVKQLYPEKTIVFGGANCEEIMGATMQRCFPFVDYVCCGEGDYIFPELLKRLEYGHPVADLPDLAHRGSAHPAVVQPDAVIQDLDALPVPDFDDYFDRLPQSPLASRIDPSILLETARGCWWGQKSHCTFCGLNGRSLMFRSKSPERCISEITHLTERYKARTIRLVDNILNLSYLRDVVPRLAEMALGATIIWEVKANLTKQQISTLAEAGVTVQAGIESLSGHTLRLMRKGTTELMNVQTLKWCKQCGVPADWNLLYGFPGETPGDYQRNLELASVLSHLDPPNGVGQIRLDRFSPNFNEAREIGLNNIRPLPHYRYLYPFDDRTLFDLVYYFAFDYAEPIDHGGYLEPLVAALDHWKKRSDELYAQRDGERLLLQDSRPVATASTLVLTGLVRDAYEYCDQARSVGQVTRAMARIGHHGVSETQLWGVLEEFVAKKLMAREGKRYLSLAVLTYTTPFESTAARPPSTRRAELAASA